MLWNPPHDFKNKAVVVFTGFVVRVYLSRYPGPRLLDQIKKLGGTWDREEEFWYLDAVEYPKLKSALLDWASNGIRFVTGDLLAPLEEHHREWLNPFKDNPQYIAPSEIEEMWGDHW